MAEFLNTDKLREQLIKIIETAQDEVVLISPYIQTNTLLLEELEKADNRGVVITIVYKEGKLSDFERKKLIKFKNLNLLSHPNLHSKCYFNEIYLIITSLNLYDYSQRNNREMGVLFRRTDEERNGLSDYKTGQDDDGFFQDAILEMKSIINGSEVEKEGQKTKEKGFEIQIAKTNYDLILEKCNLYNKYSKNKKFVPFQSGEDWYPKCENFLDKVDLVIEGRRSLIYLNFDEKRCEEIFNVLNTKKIKVILK
ncbi:phospholipase D family protein [Flavobacterium sp. WG21]|uniref:phospholipase D family protein n=1 Tax=Flavobacterium sp. WG21 TaxID=1229487 RepID=UPI00034B5A95|nr:phospholipase D family protein [Flavobacterium sp. WG21]